MQHYVMIKSKRLFLLIRRTILFAFFSITFIAAVGQTENSSNLYQTAAYIERAAISDRSKLQQLLSLKYKAEQEKTTNDTGYVYVLLYLSKLQFNVNRDAGTALQNVLSAININRTATYKIPDQKLINAYYNAAVYYDRLLSYNKELSYYDTVLQINKKLHNDIYQLNSRYYRSRIYFIIGDYQKSIEESTSAINETNIKTNLSSYLQSLNWRAQSYMFENALDNALSDVNIAVPVAEKNKDTFELANTYKIKASVFDKKIQTDSALYYFKKTVTTRSLLQTENKSLAEDYDDLGNFYMNSLHDYNNAANCFQKTEQLGRLCDKTDQNIVAIMAYNGLGKASLLKKELSKAVKFYTLSFLHAGVKNKKVLKGNLVLSDLNVTGAKEITFDLLQGNTALLLEMYKTTGQQNFIQSCINNAKLTDSFITQTRHEHLGEESKLYWRNETRSFFNTAIEASYLFNDVNSAFYFMERSRAVLLNDKWNEHIAAIHLPANENEREEGLKTSIIKQQEQLNAVTVSSKQYKMLQNNILQIKDTLEHFIKSLETKYPAYYQSKYSDAIPTLQQLQHYLASNKQSLVYYFMNDTSMYALGITNNKTRFIKISNTGFDTHQLSEFIRLCSNKLALLQSNDNFSSLSQTLYQKLFQPLQIPAGNVAICTDNFFIPFEALCSDDKGKNYLVYNYNFSYVYSARSLLKSFMYSPPGGNFIGFAPVSFSQPLGVFDLKQSATALQKTAGFYSSHTLCIEKDATRNNFLTQASHYSVVTVFSHAKADTTDAEPVLYMQDSVVQLSDLQRLNNPSIQFVLLSACQTNIGRNATGEGIYSLARGFASAGIPSVSATLWKADESAVYDISTKFNEYLSQGMNKAEALQKAKIYYLQANSDNEKSLPFYWANMVLIGSSQPIVLTPENHSWVYALTMGLAVIAASLVLYRKKKKSHSHQYPNA